MTTLRLERIETVNMTEVPDLFIQDHFRNFKLGTPPESYRFMDSMSTVEFNVAGIIDEDIKGYLLRLSAINLSNLIARTLIKYKDQLTGKHLLCDPMVYRTTTAPEGGTLDVSLDLRLRDLMAISHSGGIVTVENQVTTCYLF